MAKELFIKRLSRLASAILLVICLGIAFFLSRAGVNGFTGSSPVIYLFQGSVFLLCFLVFWKGTDEIKSSSVIFLISLGFCLYLAELVIFALDKNVKSNAVAYFSKHWTKDYDHRTPLEVVRALNASGIATVPAVLPGDLLLSAAWNSKFKTKLPLAGISNSNTVLCNESGTYAIYESDEYGFRNPKNLLKTKRLQVAAIGDSFVHGSCVQPGEDITSKIREKIPFSKAFAMGGSGPLLEFAMFREYAEPLKPEVVLWFYYEGNDLNELDLEYKNAVLKNYLNSHFSQRLYEKPGYFDPDLKVYVQSIKDLKERKSFNLSETSESFMKAAWEVFNLTRLRVRLGLKRNIVPDVSREDSLLRFFEIISLVKGTVRSWHGELYFIYLPQWSRFSSARYRREDPYKDRILKQIDTLKIPIVDITNAFDASKDPLQYFPFRMHNHYNAAGYSLIADTIIREMAKHGKNGR